MGASPLTFSTKREAPYELSTIDRVGLHFVTLSGIKNFIH
jgi:hypothetical protein